MFLLPLFLFTMCTDKYQERILAIEKERDSIQAYISVLQTEAAVKEERIKFVESKVKELEADKQRIVKKYNSQINELSKKTPQQIHEEFNKVFPTTEEPLLVVAHDQITAALVVNIEKEQCEELLQTTEKQVESLTTMVSIQRSVIENKDAQIALVVKDKDLVIEECAQRIAMCEDTLKREKRKDRLQKIGIIGAAIAALLIF